MVQLVRRSPPPPPAPEISRDLDNADSSGGGGDSINSEQGKNSSGESLEEALARLRKGGARVTRRFLDAEKAAAEVVVLVAVVAVVAAAAATAAVTVGLGFCSRNVSARVICVWW